MEEKIVNGCPEWILKKFDAFIDAAVDLIESHPYIVVILMHEYMRHLYPSDPHIPFASNKHPIDNAVDVLDRNILILENWKNIGSYQDQVLEKYENLLNQEEDIKIRTGDVYGSLWNKYPGDIVEEAINIIKERFESNSMSTGIINGKIVLDAGCGSGRYTCALARLGAEKVIGLDYGDSGLELGAKLGDVNNLKNVEFQKGSLLSMPFEDDTFDFVFANGVFHHTGDIEKGTKELYRVLKKGGVSWYFIYGDGGLYWYSRKKMNKIMKQIPQKYAMSILQSIGMPMNRFIFCDNWYVPVEQHTSNKILIELFNKVGFTNYQRAYKGRKTDFDFLVVKGEEKDRQLWGDGNLRYFITK